MSQEKQSASEANFEEANRMHNEACRAAASSNKRQAGDPPSALDSALGNHARSDVNPIKPVWSNTKYIMTPSLDPACIKAIDGYEEHEGYLAPALSAFSTAQVLLEKVAAARDPLSRDSSKTDGQRLLAMAAESEKALGRITKAFDDALKNLTTAERELDASLSKPLESRTHVAMSQELRSMLRGMKPDERGEFIGSALKRGDQLVIDAVLGAPSYMSGVHEAQKATWLRQYHESRNPVETRRLSAYRKAIQLLGDRGALALPEMERAQGGSFVDVRKLRNSTDASAKALAAIGS